MNIIVCVNADIKKNKSWGLTGSQFISALSKKGHKVVNLNYEISNPIVKYTNKLISILLYQTPDHFRNPFINFFRNLKFEYLLSKVSPKPDLIIHFGSVAITGRIGRKYSNVLVTDATISASIKFGGNKYSDQFMDSFKREFNVINKRLKLIFTFNDWTKSSLINEFDCNENKIINVGFGANLIPFHGGKDYSNSQILIILRRGLEKNKGLLLLLDAFKIAHIQNPSIKLNVVGTTLDPIEGVTYFEGYPRDMTIKLLQEAALYAMPALFEPNGMVYIEALSCKTPIMGLDRLAFPEFSGHGKYGFLVEENPEFIAEKLGSALRDPKKLEEMGLAGQKYAINRFNWDIVADKIIEESLKNKSSL
jgi:glycosyltransferase involved in cell wall biosynthesis